MCGIAGIINKMPRAFDFSTFCVLGIANDSRGGDSCGVFIDGKYDYGVDKEKLFASYFMNSDIIYETERASVALLHCRKASVGKISKETAQPVVIKDEYGKVAFVLMHNGTIYNYEDLAKKYIPDVDITGMTDSQVMAHIFYYAGYECINEYNGAAVFAIVDYRGYTPKVMLFKGSSKKTKYTALEEEERPLFYCIDKAKRELVFSSLGVPLVALRKDLEVYSLKGNILVEFNGKALVPVKIFTRENAFQQKEYNYSKSSNIVTRYSGSYWDDYNINDGYITLDETNNLFTYSDKPIMGRQCVSLYGKIVSHVSKNPKSFEVWFFRGVLLKNQYCYRFLVALEKESKLSEVDFFKKFQNVIRFLSADQLYFDGNCCYKATGPTTRVVYTGSQVKMFSYGIVNYSSGAKVSTTYTGHYGETETILSRKHDINLKSVRDECKSLMK